MPNKIKNFAWRACQNILPTKANLFHRKVISSKVVEHCDQGRETTSHVLLHCAFAQLVWEACSLVVDRNCTFEDMIWKCRNGSDPAFFELAHFMAISWNLWKNRNGIQHGDVPKSVTNIVFEASQLIAEF